MKVQPDVPLGFKMYSWAIKHKQLKWLEAGSSGGKEMALWQTIRLSCHHWMLNIKINIGINNENHNHVKSYDCHKNQ